MGAGCISVSAQAELAGEFKKWHKITLTFEGPETSETADYNPFMNYRLNVRFTHPESGKEFLVPGYFAGDGNAAETSAESGNKWRAHFSPPETGLWKYSVDFRRGNWVAVSDREDPGKSGGFMDGLNGEFSIEPTDKAYPDLRARGRLEYTGEYYLRFAGTGEYFLKCGADAPENFLAYAEFDGTFHNDGIKDDTIKTWGPHIGDWKEGDPTWQGGKGKGIIGALNYLQSEGMNAFSFIPMNIAGDDRNVFPYIDYYTWDRMDVSKLDQWEIVFEHADRLGLFLHFKTQEAENQGLLDNGGVGTLRKLYYRELIARFSHHLAMNWNLGEENGDWMQDHPTPPQSKQQRLAMARYFYDHDPYRHHVVIHNGAPFYDLLGPNSTLTGISLQTDRQDFSRIHREVLKWRNLSADAGKILAIAVDEPGDHEYSLVPDRINPGHDNARKNGLWGALMAGAWGLEWYFGYEHEHSDLTCEDWRSRDLFWDQCRHALELFNEYLPFWKMTPADHLSTADYCLALPGKVYLIYMKEGGTASLQMEEGEYSIAWYNPRIGGPLLEGSLTAVSGGTTASIGQAPSDPGLDWAVLIREK